MAEIIDGLGTPPLPTCIAPFMELSPAEQAAVRWWLKLQLPMEVCRNPHNLDGQTWVTVLSTAHPYPMYAYRLKS